MAVAYKARPRPGYSGPPLVVLKVAHGTHNDFLKYEETWMRGMIHDHILRVLPIAGSTTSQRKQHYSAKAEPNNPRSPYFIAMEYMQGGSLEDLLRLRGRLRCSEAVEIASQIAAGLKYIHAQQIVHLDLKPSNILLRKPLSRLVAQRPQVVISDFGIAQPVGRNGSDRVYGTIWYTAPERASGELPHPCNDIFALGVLLYEMVTGHLPFEDQVSSGTMLSTQRYPSELNRAVSHNLEGVILRALNTDCYQRYQTVQELQWDLDHFTGMRRPGGVRLPFFQSGRDYIVTALAGTAVMLLLLVMWAVSMAVAAPPGALWTPIKSSYLLASLPIVLSAETIRVGVVTETEPASAVWGGIDN